MNKSKIRWLLLFLLVFGILGYFREFFFVNLNNIMFMKYYQRDNPTMPVPRVMAVFMDYGYNTLYYSKYFFTLAWAAIFFVTNYFAVIKLTNSRYLVRLVLFSYAALLGISATVMLYNYFAKSSYTGDEYTLSRWLMGVAQSPLICLILLASERLYKTTTGHDKGQKDIRPH